MAILSLLELGDIVIMALILGYLFKDLFRPRLSIRDPDSWLKNVTPRRGLAALSDFWYAVLLVAPAIILHEFGHKFTAMSFGAEATFHGACSLQNLLAGNMLTGSCNLMILVVILKAIGFPFLFFVPAYVAIMGDVTLPQHFLIAFMGPLVNGALWVAAWYYLKNAKKPSKEVQRFAVITKRINGFLFILNLIPIPGFDGWYVWSNLFKML